MAYCTSSDVQRSLGDIVVPDDLDYSKYIVRADARINATLRNHFSVPLVSGEVNTDTWALINGLSADLASAYILDHYSTVSEDDARHNAATARMNDVDKFLKMVSKGDVILAGAEKATDSVDDAIIPKAYIGNPDEYSYFANKDLYNIERDARLGYENSQQPISPTTGLEIDNL